MKQIAFNGIKEKEKNYIKAQKNNRCAIKVFF